MQNKSPCLLSCRSEVTASQLQKAEDGNGKGVAILFLCQHLGPWPWQARGLEEVTRVALPSWSNTLCRSLGGWPGAWGLIQKPPDTQDLQEFRKQSGSLGVLLDEGWVG